MDHLDKLKLKIDVLIQRFEKLEAERDKVEKENRELKETIRQLEARLSDVTSEGSKREDTIQKVTEITRKRISGLVDKIDRLQEELKIS